MQCNVLIIGGGFYGCKIALHLQNLGVEHIIIAEAENNILSRASLWNQARVHNGYHYTRSFTTAMASKRHFLRFSNDHAHAIKGGMQKLYAIAKGSKVTPSQFEKFCTRIGIRFNPSKFQKRIFDSALIEEVYDVEELCFNARLIADHLLEDILNTNINLLTETKAKIINYTANDVQVNLNETTVYSRLVLNCTYSNLDKCGVTINSKLKKEWAEMALVSAPAELQNLGVTIIDGPYFSCMPFPAYGCHTLSHVRYTPINSWDAKTEDSNLLNRHGLAQPIHGEAMIRDASRYIPTLKNMEILGSIFETKAILNINEEDDGRPILFEPSLETPRIVSILGGKIDNVYDILEALNETFLSKVLS